MPVKTLLTSANAYGLPSYAKGHTGAWNASQSLYNHNGATLMSWRAWMAQVRAGAALCRFGAIGASVTAGHQSIIGIEDPYSQLRLLFQKAGFGPMGELVFLFNGTSTIDNRVSYTAGWVGSGGLLTCTSNGSATCTYSSLAVGTVVEILCLGSSATFTYTIDGGSPVSVTPSGTAMRLITVAGLANTTHTVVLNGPTSGQAVVAAIGVRSTTGLVIMNGGIGGSSTAQWLGSNAPADPINVMLAAAPDAVIIELGAIDELNSRPVSDYKTDYTSICTKLKTAHTLLFLMNHEKVDFSPAPAYSNTVFAVADQFSAPVIDLCDLMGQPIPALLVPGGAHHTPAGNWLWSNAFAELLAIPRPNV